MGRIRTFIGVDVGQDIRDRAVSLQETLARSSNDVKWVEPENLHITLLFLGEVDDREVPAVCRAVSTQLKEQPAFSLSVEGVGCFPNPRRPRILWIGVGDGTQELCKIHDLLEPPLLDLGCYRREERKYTPHLTLGRVKSERPADRLSEALAKQADWHGGQTVVKEIQVMSSTLGPHGPVYAVLSRARLVASSARAD
jgi:2'-5' RNA ligase